jgi:hypothetical protein
MGSQCPFTRSAFTTNGVFYFESLILLEEYQRKRNWQEVQAVAVQENLLQAPGAQRDTT